jgi:hypothetical protein
MCGEPQNDPLLVRIDEPERHVFRWSLRDGVGHTSVSMKTVADFDPFAGLFGMTRSRLDFLRPMIWLL